MLFETVTSTVENSNNQANKLTKAISSLQSFYLKKKLITRKNFTLKKRLQKIGTILENSGEL